MTPTMSPKTIELPEELTRMLSDADGVAERFVSGFMPMMDAKVKKVVEEVLAEDFPKLLEDPEFVKRVCDKLGPEAIEEKPFIFLSRNPEFMTADM